MNSGAGEGEYTCMMNAQGIGRALDYSSDPPRLSPHQGGFQEEQVDLVEEINGRRKKPRLEEQTIASVLECSGKALETTLLKISQAQIDTYNRNNELDRLQRKCDSDNLVAVLGRIAEAIGKVAEKL